jgi:hypothetical protein
MGKQDATKNAACPYGIYFVLSPNTWREWVKVMWGADVWYATPVGDLPLFKTWLLVQVAVTALLFWLIK